MKPEVCHTSGLFFGGDARGVPHPLPCAGYRTHHIVSTEGAGCDAAVRRATIAGAAHKAGVGRPRNALHHLLLYKANSESLSSDITGRYITNHYLPVNEAAYFPNRIEVVTVFFLTDCNTLLIIPCPPCERVPDSD